MPNAPALAPQPGTYVLWLRLSQSRSLSVGRLGEAIFPAGYYAYVGSAFGPGGVRSRLGRHLRGADALRWHIDYLRRACSVATVWVSYDARRLEHAWAAALLRLPGAYRPLAGFGASDCHCDSHLVGFGSPPALAVFRRRLQLPRPLIEQVDTSGV